MMGSKHVNKMVTPLMSILIAVIIGSIVIIFCGYSPISAYGALFKGAFGSISAFTTTFEKSLPLIFCGLAAMVGLKSGMFNIGLEGQLVMGAITYALVGLKLQSLPFPIHVIVCTICAMAGGALWALIAAGMKIWRNANEVVTTVMLNYVALYLTEYLVSGPFKAKGDIAQSNALESTHMIPALYGGSKLTWACVVAIVVVILVAFFYKYTVTGYNMMAAGMNYKAAEAGGIQMNKARLSAMAASGALAGLGGAMLVASSYGRFILNISSGYGFDGLAIAVLGQKSAIGVLLSSVLFGGLRTGSLYMAMFEGIPSELVSILQGVIILVIAAPLLIKTLSIRRKKT